MSTFHAIVWLDRSEAHVIMFDHAQRIMQHPRQETTCVVVAEVAMSAVDALADHRRVTALPEHVRTIVGIGDGAP